MSYELDTDNFPSCESFQDSIAVLNLPVSCSELHGLICGYIAAGALQKAENYLRALMIKQEKNAETKEAARALFALFEISKQQLSEADFSFRLLLPDDHFDLILRAEAFSQWCEGFVQGIQLSDRSLDSTDDEDSAEALEHFKEFAELDYDALDIDEDSEKALIEVSEYARMAVLRISSDFRSSQTGTAGDIKH